MMLKAAEVRSVSYDQYVRPSRSELIGAGSNFKGSDTTNVGNNAADDLSASDGERDD
jgi:hypothetical protein